LWGNGNKDIMPSKGVKMAKKRSIPLTISVFEIEPITAGVQSINLPKDLYSALNKTTKAKERLMPLSSDENNKDSDLISNFTYSQGFLFGSFIRLNGGEVSNVLLTSLDKKTIEINEIITEAEKGSAGSIRDKVFFCMSGDLMLMTSAWANRKALETYIDWVLREKADQDIQARFVPKKNTAKTIPIKDIQSIKIADAFLSGNVETKKETFNLTREIVKLLFHDVKNLRDLELDDIINATLTLTINKRELRKNNTAALDTALRLIDNDNIIITGKDGQTLKGTEYTLQMKRAFEPVASGYYNEKAIESEMRIIIKKIRNNEVVV
jgi:hypothetical protein